MTTVREMNIGELAAFVCSHLDRYGIRVALSGGAVVSIYAVGNYVSMDLDFIDLLQTTRQKLKKVLKEIGFEEKRRYFVSEETEFFIEFPAGPLAVGNEPVEKLSELQFKTGKLRLLSPTDCVKDRLSAFYHWGDRQCLQQAVWVAQMKPINWIEVERWSRQEGAAEKFVEFRTELQDSSAVE
jgi:hypothetical protein